MMKAMRCTNCNERYGNTHFNAASKVASKQPLILKCGHTFCELCLTRKLEKNESYVYTSQVHCPTCTKVTFLQNGLKDLPLDVYLLSYIDINQHAKLDSQLAHLSQVSLCPNRALIQKGEESQFCYNVKQKNFFCKVCKSRNYIYKCDDCESLLCHTCFQKVHAISAQMEEHKPVPFQISTNISKNKKDLALETICKDHNRPIEYFCQDDSFSICSRCYILGDHKNHSIISYEEKNKSVINDIDSELKRAVDVLDFLNKIDKQITQTLPVVKDETKSVIESINTSFLTLHALLQVREMELINSLTYSLKENLLHIEEQKLLLSKEKTLLEAAIKDANKLIENNALLIDAETLLEILKGAKKIPCIVDKKIEADIEPINWVESNCNNLLQSINAFGEIKGKQQLLIDFKTLEEAGNISSENAKISIKSNETDANKHTVMDIAVSVSTLEYNETSVSARANNESDKTSDLNTKDFTEKITISECSSHFIIKDNSNLTVKGLPQHVIVTHIRSPNNFYVQLQSSKAQLFTLSQSINSWCQREMGAKKIPFAVAKNMFVLARYSADKMWYRARIIDVYESKHGEGQLKILVTYIDFGNEEEVCLKDLRKMEKRFAKVPVFAIHCSLFDIAPYLENKPWSLEAIQDFHQMTQNHIFLLSVLSKQGELHEVDLVFMPTENVLDDGFVSVRDILVFLELGRFKMFSNEALNIPQAASYQKVDFIQPKALTVGSTFDVIVTCAISPWDFFVALTDSGQDYYNTTFQQMQEVYNKDFTNTYGLYYPRAGNVCSVKNENNKWYRGRILSSSKNKQATVNYVDTGAVQVVTFDHLKKLHCDFLKLPVQAVHCKLSAICPLDGSSTITEENWFQKVVLGSEACIKVMKWSNFAEVFLWLGKETDTVVCESINNKLVEMNLAKNVELPSIKQSTLFDIDDVKKEKELQPCSLDEGKNILENTSPPCTPEDQENVIAVQVNTSSEIHHNELPINPEPDLNNFKKFRKQKANVYSKSNLKDDLNKELPQENQSSVKIISDSSKSFTLSSCIKVLMSFYKSPSDFYVRIIDKEDHLKELMEGLQAFYAGSIHETSIRWKVNDYCTAKFSDNKWYRCNIIEKLSDHEYALHSVDYGYEHKLESSDMRRLTNEFGTKLECTAVRCHLAELLPAGSMDKNNWSKTAGEYMYQAIKDKILYIKQEGDPTELGLPVDIIMEEEKPETAFDPATHSYHSLRQCILKQGLAMPAKKSLSNKSHSDLILNRIIYEVDGQQNEHLVPSELSEANVKSRSEKVTKSEPFLPCSFENSLSTDEGENTKTGVINNLDFCSKNDNVFQVPFPPLPSVGSTLSVVVTHITDDGVIWSQPISWSSDVTQLCQELLNIFGAFNSKSIKQNMIVWRIGDICVSPFENDKLWYRAEIKDICKCRAEVFYLDFGNSAWVNLIDLEKIPSHLVDKHRMCYSLKLDDISLFPTPVLNPSTIKEINKLIISVESNIVVRDIEESTHLITVDLSRAEDGFNLIEYLINKGEALCISEDRHILAHSRMIGQAFHSISQCPQLEFVHLNDIFKAQITHIESPDVIYLQPALVDSSDQDIRWNSKILKFEKFMEKINENSKPIVKDMTFEEGKLIEGNYTEDNRWYRAVLVKNYPHCNMCLVIYFDFGTTELLPYDRLRPMCPEAYDIPVMAWRCHLPLLPPEKYEQKWTSEIQHNIRDRLFGLPVIARVVKLKPKTVLLFDGIDSNINLLKAMVDEGIVQLASVQSDEQCDHEEVQVSKLYHIADIDCQLTEQEYQEIENLVCNAPDLPFIKDEKPFWSLGYENLLTKEQRREMIVYLARLLFYSRKRQF